MARAIWTGAISFGLVSVPVGLYSATEEHEVSFHQFEEGTSDRIRYRRVNERTGEEVPYERIVKGVEIGDGGYVLVSREELAEVAPGRSRLLAIHSFVDADEIDPIFFQRSYYLAPSDATTARTYALLHAAMTATNRAGIATFVMRTKEYLAAIRPAGDVLTLETMYFADEIRDPRAELDTLPEEPAFRGQELRMAEQLIESMSGPWQPEAFHDTYTQRVEQLIEAKRAGGEVVAEPEPPRATDVIDLISVLRQSVEAARRGRKAAPDSSGRPASHPDTSTKSKQDNDLQAMTKAELTDLARRLHVPGRSTMKRAELVRAVAAARQEGGVSGRRAS